MVSEELVQEYSNLLKERYYIREYTHSVLVEKAVCGVNLKIDALRERLTEEERGEAERRHRMWVYKRWSQGW